MRHSFTGIATLLIVCALADASAFLLSSSRSALNNVHSRARCCSGIRLNAHKISRSSVRLREFPRNFRMSGHVEVVDAEGLEVALQETSGPMVIDFYATWCGPCVMLAPQLEQVANEYAGAVRFLKIDTDQNEAMASSMKIFGLPTLLFVKEGKILRRIEGALMANKLKAVCDYLFFGGPKPEDQMLRTLLEDDLLV